MAFSFLSLIIVFGLFGFSLDIPLVLAHFFWLKGTRLWYDRMDNDTLLAMGKHGVFFFSGHFINFQLFWSLLFYELLLHYGTNYINGFRSFCSHLVVFDLDYLHCSFLSIEWPFSRQPEKKKMNTKLLRFHRSPLNLVQLLKSS